MLKAFQILVRHSALTVCVAALSACGQRGPLYLPDGPASAQRATLPQTLTPQLPLGTAPSPSLPASATP